jgi:hypothetical protein
MPERDPAQPVAPETEAPEQGAAGAVCLDIEVGGSVLVEIEGLRRSFKSRFVGWDCGRFVLMTFPSRPEIRDHLYQDRGLILRYLHKDGVLRGFHSTVDAVLFKPERLLFARYPTSVESLSLRKEDRVNCFVRARVAPAAGGAETAGLLLNISRSGCRLALGAQPPAPHPQHVVGQALTLTSRFFGLPEERRVPVSVRALHLEPGRLSLGLLFDALPEDIVREIDAYTQDIRTTLGLPGEP